jgi:eukaryotic-like serine/threonine-protein kinase
MCGRDFSRLLAELHRLFMRLFMEVAIWKRFGLRSRATGRTRPVRASQGSSDTGCAQSVPRRRWRLARSVDFSEQEDDLLDQLAEEYQKRLQRGEDPNIEEYAADHPEIAEAIRELFQTIKQVEDLKKSDPDSQINPLSNRACPATEELAGRQLGDFQIIREIGRGGMGVVYEATQISLKRRVALKVLESAKALDSKNLQRFQIEGQAAAGLQHPNIVPVFCVDCVEGVHCYAMPFIEGCNLHDALREPGRIASLTAPNSPLRLNDFSTVARLGMEAAEALEHAHRQGIVHRDIKPANLMVDAEANLWVTDFGLARLQSDNGLTVSGDLLGTWRYMSPEQALGLPKAVDRRTDIYSLGATIYELLTLWPAIKGKSRQEILRKIAEEEPIPPRKHDRSIPRDLETIVLKAMAKKPASRYSTAQEMADDLLRFLNGKPVRARRAGVFKKGWMWCRRRPAAAALAAAVVTGLIVSTSGWLTALDALSDARQRLYDYQMTRLQRYWDGHNAKLFMQDLREQVAANRGGANGRAFELNYWRRKASSGHVTLDGPVDALAFSPDGKRLVTGNRNGTLTVRDLETGESVPVIKRLPSGVTSVAFSPDGECVIYSCTSNPRINVLKVQNRGGIIVRSVNTDALFDGVTFSPNGKSFAADRIELFESQVSLFGLDRGELVREYEPPRDRRRRRETAFSSDGRLLAVAGETVSNGEIHVFNINDKSSRPIFSTKTEKMPAGMAFGPDGRRIAFGDVGIVKVWDMLDNRELLTIKAHDQFICALAFSADGARVATAGSDRTVRVWDAETGKPLRVLKGCDGYVRTLAFSPDGRWIASVDEGGTADVWDAERYQDALTLGKGRGSGPTTVVFSPDGRWIVSDRGGTLEVRDSGTGKLLGSLDCRSGRVSGVAFSPDSRRIVCKTAGDRTIMVWSTDNWALIRTHERFDGKIMGVAFSADGRRIAYAGHGTVIVCDAATGEDVLTLERLAWDFPGGLECEALSPDAKQYALCGADATKVWDVASGRETLTLAGHNGGVKNVAFSPDGKRIATASDDGTVKVWDTTRGTLIHTLKGHNEVVNGVAFSPDSKRIATASDDGTAKVWDAATGQETLTLNEHTGAVRGVAFSPDGMRIATASDDGTVKVWDARPVDAELAETIPSAP